MSGAATAAGSGAQLPGFTRFAGDPQLARRAAAGDERAFAAIFRRYHQDLYRYCLAILGNPEDAQDALQNAMVKALRALPGESREIELKPWLYRVAHNEAIDLVRRRRGGEPLDPELVAAGPGLAQEAEARARLGTLLSDLETLPDSQRGALVLRELSGLDFEAIAAVLGTSAATARQTLYEARLSLRQLEAGREMSCDSVTKALSDADGRVLRRRDIRAHLRSCADCRAFRAEIDGRSRDLAALSPLPALAVAGILQGLFGGGGGAAGGGLAGLLGGGAAQAVGTSAAVKATATVAVVAALGGAAAQRADLVDLGLPVGGGSDPKPAAAAPGSTGAAPGSTGASDPDRAAAEPSGPATALGAGSRAGLPATQGLAGAREANGAAGSDRQSAANAPAAPLADPARGSDRLLPEAAAKGQQTAAAKHSARGKSPSRGMNSARGKSASAGQNAHPVYPEHPAHPAKPAKPAPPAQPVKPDRAAAPDTPAGKSGERAAPAASAGGEHANGASDRAASTPGPPDRP
jgi:RNA polymerase sigma factor (sigma-70 family)